MEVRLHEHERDRLASLRSYEVLDSQPEEAFDALTRLARQVCEAPISLVSLVDADRQWWLSRSGIDAVQTPREQSVCSDVVAAGSPVLLSDMTAVPRYSQVAAELGIQAYAGVPLVGRDGLPLGALCVIDRAPRRFSEAQMTALTDLAGQVVALLELRRYDLASGLRSSALVPEAAEPVSLRRALDDHQFVPYFQPVVDMSTGTVTGLEALVRWQHPSRGLLTPVAFLPGLETGTLATWTGQAVLSATCALLTDLRSRALNIKGRVAINVSRQQLLVPGLAGQVLATLARHELPGTVLTVEITETAEVTDLALARRELLALRDQGVKVVADDFGVGWSNLVRLVQLPLAGLKIDRQLVTGMLDDPVREQMVRSTLNLAATIGLDVVAEGVETTPVRDRLLELGCAQGQGWLYSPAVPSHSVASLLATTYPHPANSSTEPPRSPART